MNSLTNVSFRIDSQLKRQADALFIELGLNMTTAFNMFLRQAVREGKIPFELSIVRENADTVASILEARMLAEDKKQAGLDVDVALHELKK